MALIRSITAVNTSESDASKWALYLVGNGDTADDSNILITYTSANEVAAGAKSDYSTWKVLDAGSTIQAKAENDITLHIDGALVPV